MTKGDKVLVLCEGGLLPLVGKHAEDMRIPQGCEMIGPMGRAAMAELVELCADGESAVVSIPFGFKPSGTQDRLGQGDDYGKGHFTVSLAEVVELDAVPVEPAAAAAAPARAKAAPAKAALKPQKLARKGS